MIIYTNLASAMLRIMDWQSKQQMHAGNKFSLRFFFLFLVYQHIFWMCVGTRSKVQTQSQQPELEMQMDLR